MSIIIILFIHFWVGLMNRGGIGIGIGGPMRRSFKDSLKVLEADIQHANTL